MAVSSLKTSAVKQPAEVELVITRVFGAPRNLVVKCWTDLSELSETESKE